MRGFAFDLEGTCVDLEIFHFKAYERALAYIGISMRAEDIAAIPSAVGGGGSVIFAALSPSHPMLTEATLREHKERYFNEMFEKAELAPRIGLTDTIESLLAEGLPISIGSTTRRCFGEAILQRSGLALYFKSEICIFREDVTSLKPSAEVYLRTAELMHIPPHEQTVFEDSVVGIKSGIAARSTVIAIPVPFASSKQQKDALRAAGAHALYSEWTMIPRDLTRLAHDKDLLRGGALGC